LLDVLDNYLRLLGKRFLRLDGNTTRDSRQGLCDKFNQDTHIFAFLISTLAGGTGLNLTGASKVVIFDPNWNPAHDLQAQDRAYRIGQSENVQIYRLISQGTIEERMLVSQVHKQKLASMTLDSDNFQKRIFEQREIRGVLSKLEYSRDSFAQKTRLNVKQKSAFQSTKKPDRLRAFGTDDGDKKMTFRILDEDCEVFEECGVKDTIQWNEVVAHDEEAKQDELAAVAAMRSIDQALVASPSSSD